MVISRATDKKRFSVARLIAKAFLIDQETDDFMSAFSSSVCAMIYGVVYVIKRKDIKDEPLINIQTKYGNRE